MTLTVTLTLPAHDMHIRRVTWADNSIINMHADVTHADVTHGEMTHADVTHGEMTHGEVTHGEVTHDNVTNYTIDCHQAKKME